jgi:low temperature requirement protein LtrA
MSRREIFSAQDARFWTFMIALAGFVIGTAPSFNQLPFPYPLYGIVSPFLILAMMYMYIFHTIPRVVRQKSRSHRKPKTIKKMK